MLAPDALLDEIYDGEFGLSPTNFSIKPVHVANGLCRHLTGRTYKSKALTATLRRWVRNQRQGIDEERHSNAEIIRDYPDAFGDHPREDRLSDLRSLARGVLDADSGVYDDPDKSSFTLANERFITADISDYRSGLFLGRLLTTPAPGDAATHLLQALSDDGDAWTTLALPLLSLAEMREVPTESPTATLAARADALFTVKDDLLEESTLRRLREAYDRLGRFEAGSGSKLNGLRRLVLFGCFAIHIHLLNRWGDVNSAAPRPPILLDLFDGARPSVLDASRATVRGAGDAIEGLLRQRIREHIDGELPADAADSAAGELISGIEKWSAEVQQRFDVQRMEGETSVHEALTEAMLDVGLEKAGGHPIIFMTELGRRAGFLTPWANQGRGGRQQKRYGVTAEFLEILVAATVDPDDPLEFPEFCDRLTQDYGIVVGRLQDDDVIRRNNLRPTPFGTPISVSEEDLRHNVAALQRVIEEAGYAKTYADGRTIVTTTPEMLISL